MSQFRLLEPQQADPEARKHLESVQAKLGRLPNLFKAMAHSPATLEAYLAIGQALENGRVSPQLRERIALAVAENNGCDYCLAAHTAIGRSLGLTKDEIINNRRAQSSDPSASAVLTFVKSLVENRGNVSSTDLEGLHAAGFDDGQVAEIVTTVVINIFTNYFNLIAETPVDFPKVEALPPVHEGTHKQQQV